MSCKKDDVVYLYRAVSAAEFYSIMQSKQFSVLPTASNVKYFGLDFGETLNFAEKIGVLDIVAVVEVSVLRLTLEQIGDYTHVDPFLFKKGTVIIQQEHLNEFNAAIKSIRHRY